MTSTQSVRNDLSDEGSDKGRKVGTTHRPRRLVLVAGLGVAAVVVAGVVAGVALLPGVATWSG